MKTRGDLAMYQRLLLLLVGSLVPLLAQTAPAQVLIVANPSLKAAAISKAEVRDVFTGSSSELPGGSHVTPVLLVQGSVNDEFLGLFIGKSDSAFRTGWRSLLFSGQGIMPKTLNSDAAVVEYVARTPGAIGYISKNTPIVGVKILAVR
jgi:hypothetical protein